MHDTDLKGEFNTNQGRIVGFLVEPISVKHKYEGEWDESKGSEQLTSCYDGEPWMQAAAHPLPYSRAPVAESGLCRYPDAVDGFPPCPYDY